MASTIFIVTLCVETIIYIFHASVLLLLFCKRKTSFKSPFYDIFRIVLVADLITFVSLILGTRAALLFFEFYKNNSYISAINLSIASYTSFVQYLGHLFMAFNRYTIFCIPTKHENIWQRNWYTWALIILPFFGVCYRLHVPLNIILSPDNVVITSLTDANISAFMSILTTTIYVLTTALAATFNILSFINFYSLKRSGNIQNVKEKNLFFVTWLIFIAQVFRLSYTLGRPLFASNPAITAIIVAALPFVSDIFAWTGSISLLLLSPTTRKDYISFYACRSQPKPQLTNSHPFIF